MKCPKCGGTGEMQICEMGFIGKDECDECHGKGYLTNDEWRKTCSAEEFADFLAGVAHAGAYEVRNCNTNGMLQTQNTDFWLAWLKEKHNGSV